MSPRWLTIEKLVAELGGVCTARDEARRLAEDESPDIDEALRTATQAVRAVLTESTAVVDDPSQPDEVVREAWTAIAVAQDRVARLSEEVERSRRLRDRAQDLQDRSLQLRVQDRRRRDQR